MSAINTVLRELVSNGAGTSADVAEATGMTVKRASTYLSRLAERGQVRRGEALRMGDEGRPYFLYWPENTA